MEEHAIFKGVRGGTDYGFMIKVLLMYQYIMVPN
jgi:hypothetical protein